MIKKITILIFILIGVLFAFKLGITVPCPFHAITGFYCPGCGITRCIISLLHFDFYRAFRYNPLVFILLPFISAYILYKLYIWLFEKEDKVTKKLVGYPMYILIIILLIYGILRNTSLFSWLAPTIIP